MEFHELIDHIKLQKVHIYWFLCGNKNTASVRMQALRLHKMLAFSEYRSQIVQEPCEYDDRIVLSDEQQEKFFSEALQKDDIIILHK